MNSSVKISLQLNALCFQKFSICQWLLTLIRANRKDHVTYPRIDRWTTFHRFTFQSFDAQKKDKRNSRLETSKFKRCDM